MAYAAIAIDYFAIIARLMALSATPLIFADSRRIAIFADGDAYGLCWLRHSASGRRQLCRRASCTCRRFRAASHII